MGHAKRICYLSPMRAVKVQASLPSRAVSPEPSLLAHTNSESRGTFRQKARSLAPLNGWACAVEICHDGMLEDTNSLDGAHMKTPANVFLIFIMHKSDITQNKGVVIKWWQFFGAAFCCRIKHGSVSLAISNVGALCS